MKKKIFGRKQNPYFNYEAYADPTPYYAIKSMSDDDKLNKLIGIIKDVTAMSNFEIIGRIEFRNKKTGKIYK